MRIGVLTSGGDAPGMNAAIHSVAGVGIHLGHEVVGIRRGYEGLLDGDVVPLTLTQVDGISRFGGTMLGSARSAEFPTTDGQARARARIAEIGLDGLVVIGGNGSLTGAHALVHEPAACKVVGIPASIDNDVGFSRLSIGVDTAVNTIVEACDRISDTARAHRRAFIVEVMGRDCGYLAMRAGIAAEADAILFPEGNGGDDLEERTVAELRTLLKRSFSEERGKKRVLVVCAEGFAVSTQQLRKRLAATLAEDAPGVSIRETVLGHVVRGGSPSAIDRLISQRLAAAAVGALHAGMTDVMAAWEPDRPVGTETQDRSVRLVPLAAVLSETADMLDATSPTTQARLQMLRAATEIISQ